MKKIPFKIPNSISKTSIYQNALCIVNRLQNHGYQTFFVGGFVRDLLINNCHEFKGDIDIVTGASPSEIKELFSNCLTVGESFLVSRIQVNNLTFEVATFRKESEFNNYRHPSKVEIGTWNDDSKRRDFTINSLYYNPYCHIIYDPNEGIDDILSCTLRCIGNPFIRFQEDALRIFRFFRFLVNLNFYPDKKTLFAISISLNLLEKISFERVQLEIQKVRTNEIEKFFYFIENFKINRSKIQTKIKIISSEQLSQNLVTFPLTLLLLNGYCGNPFQSHSYKIPFFNQDKNAFDFIIDVLSKEKINFKSLNKIKTLLIKECKELLRLIIHICRFKELTHLRTLAIQWYCRMSSWDQNCTLLDYFRYLKVEWSNNEIVSLVESLNLSNMSIGKLITYQKNNMIWEPDLLAPWRYFDLVRLAGEIN